MNDYIEKRPSRVVGERAFIAGTRVSVENVYVCHELQGMTPDEIVAAYPHLTLAQVHAALAYYFDHADGIREQLEQGKQHVRQAESDQEPTRFSSLRMPC